MGQFVDSLWVSRHLGLSLDHRLWLSTNDVTSPISLRNSFWSLVIGLTFFDNIQRCRIVQNSSLIFNDIYWYKRGVDHLPRNDIQFFLQSLSATPFMMSQEEQTPHWWVGNAAWIRGFDSVSIQTPGWCNKTSALAGGCKHVAKFPGELWH